MALSFVFSMAAVAAMIPAAASAFLRRGEGLGDGVSKIFLALAVAGPVILALSLLTRQWRVDLSAALWLSIASILVCFLVTCAVNRTALKLAPLLLPYLILLGLAATAFGAEEGQAIASGLPSAWIAAHVLLSIITYALLTLAAVAGLSVFVTERALKRKSFGGLSGLLPAVMEAEALQNQLLRTSAIVLLAGLASGMALQVLEAQRILVADHKTILSIAAFVVIVGLLAAQRFLGVRGRIAARIVLAAYLFLTLGYLGVKFVTDFLL